MVDISLNLSGVPSTVRELHVHIEYAQEIATAITAMEEKVSALTDAVLQVKNDTSSLLDSVTELLKDVQRLITDGNTSGAVASLAEAASNLETAKTNLDSLDAAVEVADPEPVATPAPAPAVEENPADAIS